MALPAARARPRLGLAIPPWEGTRGRPALRWSEIQARAVAAEDAGIDSLWTCDDLLWEGDPPIGFWEGWSLLAAIAAVTRRVELGLSVASNNFRNPALLAKMADTVDEISGGRLILGIGAGGVEFEHRAFGFPWERRVARLEEALQIIVPLLREGAVDFQGEFYTVRECELRPRGPRPSGPPILLASAKNAPRMLRLTAQYAGMWHAILAFGRSHPDEIPPLREAVDAACQAAGRDPVSLVRTAGVGVALDGPAMTIFDGGEPIRGSIEEIASAFWAFADEGISHLMLHTSLETAAPIEKLGRVIELMDRGR
jgi:alkanesulfonate monooxygenase SsuD/methylene tetrahydromethanopterin reductase-like flavin-dependent oxidoreductase (luciferase family)